jgi:hypothetical protein
MLVVASSLRLDKWFIFTQDINSRTLFYKKDRHLDRFIVSTTIVSPASFELYRLALAGMSALYFIR